MLLISAIFPLAIGWSPWGSLTPKARVGTVRTACDCLRQTKRVLNTYIVLSMIAGVPGHPLFIHAAVVFAPVAALASIWWAVRPEWKKLLQAAVVINFLSAVFTWLARSSGEALLKMQGLSEENPGRLAKHAEYANYLTASVIVLFVAVVGFFLVDRFVSLPTWLANVLRVIAVLAAIAVVATVVMTGHEGAVQVWND